MPSQILNKFGTIVKPTITLASLSNGAGRVSAAVDNATVRATSAQVFVRIKTGASAPTSNAPVKLYLIRHSNDGTTPLVDGALGTTDAAVSTEPRNAEQIGVIAVTTATATTYEASFIARDLTPKYSICVWNAVGQTLSTTGGDFELQVLPITLEAQ
jgi:hypothetical protein